MFHSLGPPALETYILILISTVFVNNIVMAKILGLCPFMGVSKKLEAAIGMGLATTFVLTLASGASYLVNEYLLGTELFYLTTLSFIVVIAGIVQFTEMVIQKTSPVLYQVLGIYLPLITTNCACWDSAAERAGAAQFCRVAVLRRRRGARLHPGAGAVRRHP
jgi:electron transport complex protein RnfA